MVMDALRGYVQLANGLTEVTKQRAQQAAKALLQQTGADALTAGVTTKVSDLAEEIVATSKSNRQLLQAIVANEVEGAVARLGFVRVEEVSALSRRVATLERELVAARSAAAEATATAARKTPAQNAPVKVSPVKAPAQKAAAKKLPAPATAPVPAKKSAATVAKKAPAAKAPATKAPAKKAAARKAIAEVAEKTVAQKTAAKKAPARKTAARKATGAEGVR
jgi:hypothetical protein